MMIFFYSLIINCANCFLFLKLCRHHFVAQDDLHRAHLRPWCGLERQLFGLNSESTTNLETSLSGSRKKPRLAVLCKASLHLQGEEGSGAVSVAKSEFQERDGNWSNLHRIRVRSLLSNFFSNYQLNHALLLLRLYWCDSEPESFAVREVNSKLVGCFADIDVGGEKVEAITGWELTALALNSSACSSFGNMCEKL